MTIEEIRKNAPEFDLRMEYMEGAIVNINGELYVLFKNPYLNNDLIWSPLGAPPIGYKPLN